MLSSPLGRRSPEPVLRGRRPGVAALLGSATRSPDWRGTLLRSRPLRGSPPSSHRCHRGRSRGSALRPSMRTAPRARACSPLPARRNRCERAGPRAARGRVAGSSHELPVLVDGLPDFLMGCGCSRSGGLRRIGPAVGTGGWGPSSRHADAASGRRCIGPRGHANRTDALSSALCIFPLTAFRSTFVRDG